MTAPAIRAATARYIPADLGRFCWDLGRGEALWSDSNYRLHGYHPGQAIPSTNLTFKHKLAEDLYGCVDALHAGLLDNRLIVHEHRLVDRRGLIRPVVLIARPCGTIHPTANSLCGFLLPTDFERQPAGDATLEGPTTSFVPVLMSAFRVTEATALVMSAARLPLTQRRTAHHRALARSEAVTDACWDLRHALEDSMFPLHHLRLDSFDLAA
jgi:hypothetical protein